ncbi:MAG: polyprenol monophosphomannose synthase [Bryobacteraceae bacterium]|jgi:dolichol-phosphate mannosyltransferase
MLQVAENAVEELLTTPGDALLVPPHCESPPALKLSLVVPTFNEAENIASFLQSVYGQLRPVLGEAFEVIVVDDDSPDGTWKLAAGLMPSLANLRVLRRRGERGLASAVIRGWQSARGEWLGAIDADFQHPPEILPRMLALTAGNENGAVDLVAASRYCESGSVGDWNLYRRLASRGAYLLGRLLVPHIFRRVSDPLTGCYLVRRSAISGIAFNPAGYKTLIETLSCSRVGRIAEAGYCFQKRRAGYSKALPKEYWLYLRHLGRLRRTLSGRNPSEH